MLENYVKKYLLLLIISDSIRSLCFASTIRPWSFLLARWCLDIGRCGSQIRTWIWSFLINGHVLWVLSINEIASFLIDQYCCPACPESRLSLFYWQQGWEDLESRSWKSSETELVRYLQSILYHVFGNLEEKVESKNLCQRIFWWCGMSKNNVMITCVKLRSFRLWTLILKFIRSLMFWN